jgi:hypothetical protein
MRFLMTYVADDKGPPSPEKMAAIAKLGEDAMKAGVLVDQGGIMPLSQGALTRQARGKFSVTDGPFPETKELIVGYAIFDLKSREEAIEMSRRFMEAAGDGETEIRLLFSAADGPHH